MNKQMSRLERLAAYHHEIDELTQQIEDVTSGRLDIRMRGDAGEFLPMEVEAEVSHLRKRIAIMEDALVLAQAGGSDQSETHPKQSTRSEGEGELFYKSANGDEWRLVEDVGHRRFVRHIPNVSSGGEVDVVDLEAFRLRSPRSPQNDNLEKLLASTAAQ